MLGTVTLYVLLGVVLIVSLAMVLVGLAIFAGCLIGDLIKHYVDVKRARRWDRPEE